ncbi:uncharacterized protein LOC128724901 [Anopheles nili]|uniref:uncharacterized protein LOC128724901 n=1 Tax=Anopheles nili TaxID=185578 RepID=UPI00237AB3B4|nr:uncharacterized protein LOC128724901 [Anopheles nili]
MFSGCHVWFANQRKKCHNLRWGSCIGRPKVSAAEFAVFDQGSWTPDTPRHQSLPRRILGRFMSDNSVDDKTEQMALKQMLKEHGLYNRHQTVQQRRRLKQLLELERGESRLSDDRGDTSIVMHSLESGKQTCTVDVHQQNSLLFPASDNAICCPVYTTKVQENAQHLRRVTSLPSVFPTGSTKWSLNAAPVSQPAMLEESMKTKCLKKISWKQTGHTEMTSSYLETAV